MSSVVMEVDIVWATAKTVANSIEGTENCSIVDLLQSLSTESNSANAKCVHVLTVKDWIYGNKEINGLQFR